MMDDREEGELSGSDFEDTVYNPIVRPDATLYRNMSQEAMISEDEQSSTDSDSDSDLPKRKRPCFAPSTIINGKMDTAGQQRKKNNIWANVLQEECLMQDIRGVGLKKINSDRNVESYDYTQALALHHNDDDEEDPQEQNKVDKKSLQSRLSNGKRKRERDKKEKPRYLKDFEIDPEWSDADLGNAMADALFEAKPELLVRCVEILGRDLSMKIYKETQKIEKEGGIMVLNGSRRRTSGGVYFLILKSFEGVTREHIENIFQEDRMVQQNRKKKKAHRRNRKDEKLEDNSKGVEDDALYIRGLFTDDPGGTKCPGSTPVTSPQDSASDEEQSVFKPPPLPLKEVCERAAIEIEEREQRSLHNSPLDMKPSADEMEVV